MTDEELLLLHRQIVGIPSVSRAEGDLCDFLEEWLRARAGAAAVRRIGNNLFAACGREPFLCLNTHIDTVPPAPGWTRDPWEPVREDGRVYGLGSNDAKASVAAMIAAFLRLEKRAGAGDLGAGNLGAGVLLALASEEETGGAGTEALLPELRRWGFDPEAAIVGEPTGLDIAVAQKGLLILELRAHGRACHAAHGRALAAVNAVRLLARDLAALDSVGLGETHPLLGPASLEPTIVSGGTARNMIPAEASAILDVRTNPHPDHEELVAFLRGVVEGEIEVLSDRLRPCEIDPENRLVRAAQLARPDAALFGSRGMSDLVHFAGKPGIKVGPGRSERSHTPDEFIDEAEILAGARFYEKTILAYGTLRKEEPQSGAFVGSR